MLKNYFPPSFASFKLSFILVFGDYGVDEMVSYFRPRLRCDEITKGQRPTHAVTNRALEFCHSAVIYTVDLVVINGFNKLFKTIIHTFLHTLSLCS